MLLDKSVTFMDQCRILFLISFALNNAFLKTNFNSLISICLENEREDIIAGNHQTKQLSEIAFSSDSLNNYFRKC